MLKEIMAKLVAKYPGLPKNFLGLLAKQLESKVTDQAGIDDAVNSLDNSPIPIETLAQEFQKEADRRVAEALKKDPPKKDPATPEKTDPKTEEQKPPTGDETPAWAKAMMDKLAALEADKQKSTIMSRLETDLKGIPEAFGWKLRVIPTKDEEIEAFVTKVKEDYQTLTKASTEGTLLNLETPGGGAAGGGDSKPATDKEVDAVVANLPL